MPFLCLFLGVEPWTFEQKLVEAVFIPAGCPYQIRNVKVASWTSRLNLCSLPPSLSLLMEQQMTRCFHLRSPASTLQWALFPLKMLASVLS